MSKLASYDGVEVGLGILITLVFYWLIVRNRRWLTSGGFVGAVALGITIFTAFGARALTYPIVFLAVGSLLSKLNKGRGEHDDSEGRNLLQVLSNGGPALLIAFIYLGYPLSTLYLVFITSFSIAISDTVSSEVGRYYGGRTVDVVTFKPLPPGRSGGVSTMGTLAGFVGALIVGILALFIEHMPYIDIVMIVCFGFGGMLLDSLLGSQLQAVYQTDDIATEMGQRQDLVKGIHLIDNNMVNLLSISSTSLLLYLTIAN